MRFTVFDRWGNQTGTIPDVIEAVHADEVNGEDSLTLLLPACDLSKGDRIVWRDKFLVWHEHTVNDIKAVHQDGKAYSTVYCESSLAELWTDYLEDVRNRDVTAAVAMGKALSKSRWEVGRVEIPKVATTSYYHESAREALNDVVKAYGGELSVSVAVEGTGIASRKVSLLKRRGEDSGKRFEYSKDIKGITREVAVDDVCTALYGYGKGLEQVSDDGHPTGGYDRKLTFGDINNGKDYVADEKAKERWGLPDGKGGKKHCFGKVEFSDCEDKAELKALTLAELEKRKAPRVTYEADVVDLADAGFAGEDVRPGDVVALIDRDLGERLVGRVLRVERYLYNEQATKITIGNASRRITDVLAQTKSQLDSLNSRSGTWDGMARLSEGYMQRLVSSLNNTMNQTGGYTYMEPGEGIITYDRPKDQNPTMAIQIKGAGFRIANAKKANGDWDWRTFGTAAGFTADEINAGTIRGGNSWWNLGTGDLHLGQGSIQSSNGSHWNLGGGDFQTVYKLSESLTTSSSTMKVYSETVIAVEMSSDTPFAIYKGSRMRTEKGGKVTYGAVFNKNFVGGLKVDGSNAYLRAARAGTSDSLYLTTGTTSAGNPGASFVDDGVVYADIEALHAVDSPAGETNGVGFACLDKAFLDVSTYYNRVWMYPPTYKDTYLKQPPEQLMLERGKRVYLQRSEDQGVFFGDGYAQLQLDSTHYVRIDQTGVSCRCGSKGFGWHNGAFAEELTWS